MVYNTENGASLQKLPDKSQISGKRQCILLLLLEMEKKERKTRNTFQKHSSRLARAFSTIRTQQAGLEQSRKKMFLRNLPRTRQPDISGNTGTIRK